MGGPGAKWSTRPTFSMYAIDAASTGTEVVGVPKTRLLDRRRARALPREGDVDIVIIANPNNPTGDLTDESFLIDLLGASDAIVMVDELRSAATRCGRT